MARIGSISSDADLSSLVANKAYSKKTYPQRDTTVVSLFQTGHGWTTSGAVGSSELNDTTDFVKGTQSARVTTNGSAGGGANLQKLSGLNLDLTDKVIKVIMKVDDIAALAQFNLLVGTNDSFSNNFKWQLNVKNASSSLIQSDEWVTLLFNWADVHSAGGTFSLDANRNPSATSGFTKMRFQVIDASTALTFRVQSVEIIDNMNVDYPNGVVSIVFDDSWADTFHVAKPVMDAHGFRGTAYTIADSVGDAGRMTIQELQDMQNHSGWEIAGHAYSQTLHDNRYTAYTAAEVEADLRQTRDWLKDNGLEGSSFAYPGGFFERTTDDVSIESLVAKYFDSGRTVLTGYGASTNVITDQAPAPRPFRLLAQSGISEASSGADLPSFYVGAGGELDTCANLGSWLILVFHKVVDDTPADTTEVSLDGFTDIIEGIASRGITVLPVEEVMRREEEKYISASATELEALVGVTGPVQTQLDEKLVTSSNLSDVPDTTTARDNLDTQSKIGITVGPTGDLGYVTDGTADDVQINAMIQALGAAGGGVGFVQPGTYDITATIVNDQEAVLVKGADVAHFGKATYFLASGSLETMATIAHLSPGGFEDIYMDGNNIATFGLVIGTDSTTTKIKNPIVRNLRIEKFTSGTVGKAISGTGTPASGAWDDVTFQNIRIATCDVGVENHSTKTTFLGGAIGGCTVGVSALISSAADFFGTVFTTNTRDLDVQTANSTGNYSFHGCYFESSTNSIIGRSVGPSGADTVGGFTFTSCYFRNQSQPTTGYALDFTNFGCTVLLNNNSYDVAANASRTINVGTNTKVIVVGKGIGNTPLFTGTVANVTYFGDNRLGVGKSLPDTVLHTYEDNTGVGANTGIAVEQDGTGDALVQFILTATRRWVMGIDNSDGDAFKISPTLDLSTGVAWKMDTSGNVTLPGNLVVTGTIEPSAGHLSLKAAANSLVKTTVLRQDNTTDSYQVGNTVILTGWGVFAQGEAANKSEAVTFGITFTSIPIVTISYGGDQTGGTIGLGNGGNTVKGPVAIKAYGESTTGFTAHAHTSDGTLWGATDNVYYKWTAIGQIA